MFNQYISIKIADTLKKIYQIDFNPSVISGQKSHYQFNGCFQISKILNKPILDLANEISLAINDNKINSFVSDLGFININIQDAFMNDFMSNYELPVYNKNNKNILIDYGGPNIAKPLHVGHLRSFVVGSFLENLFKYYGYNVITDIHLGDWGLPMGQIVSEIIDTKCNITCNNLLELYPIASKKCKEDTNKMNVAKEITGYIQNKQEPFFSIWKQIKDVSLNEISCVLKKLNIKFSLFLGESDSCYDIPIVENILLEKKLLNYSYNAMVCNVSEDNDKKEIPPFLFKKSDGSYLYGTTDIATLYKRNIDYNLSKCIYVTDSRQDMHFKQLFRVAKKMDINIDLLHIGFGTVNDLNGKPFKTRDGGVESLQNLFKKAHEKVFNTIDLDISLEEKNKIADIISIGSMKFYDLMNKVENGYIYNLDEMLNIHGKTGPYVFYSLVRAKKILEQEIFKEPEYYVFNDVEKQLIIELSNLSNILNKTLKTLQPYHLIDYIYDCSKMFSKFYEQCSIKKENNIQIKMSRLKICIFYIKSLNMCLNILGIQYPERM
jgi:arginyl-tRNA synthetase